MNRIFKKIEYSHPLVSYSCRWFFYTFFYDCCRGDGKKFAGVRSKYLVYPVRVHGCTLVNFDKLTEDDVAVTVGLPLSSG